MNPNTPSADPGQSWLRAARRHPLVPAAVCFLDGAAMGMGWSGPVESTLLASGIFAGLWVVGERFVPHPARRWATQIFLALAIVFAGLSLAHLNRHYVAVNHVARLAGGEDAVAITGRVRVVTAPEESSGHGNVYWVGSVTEILTSVGWRAATGDVRVKWRAGPGNAELHRGDLVEVCGWLRRPDGAMNPGGMDMRAFLAADRIFAQVDIPRASGVVVLSPSGERAGVLDRMRLFLRSKLLEHTSRIDTEAGYSMVALLLGYRHPVIDDINQAFADAGIAHLLAISGSHIVFFTGIVWWLLGFIPMRPRARELLIGAIVFGYVLATPCGPPVVRAAVALLMVLLARLIGRPRMLMNMLAAAAMIVVLMRPADLFDAGAQLSFVCTAGLILFAERLYQAMARRWVERQRVLVDLSNSRARRWKLRAGEWLFAIVAANVIGAMTAIPLVAYHFGRVNIYGVLTGLVALPFVAMAMGASAIQLILELLGGRVAEAVAPISTGIARGMIWVVSQLAGLPGSSLALRAPPAWLVGMMFGVLMLWAGRRWLKVSRAMVVNAGMAVICVATGWYAWTQPVGEMRVEVLSVGQGSSVVIRMPSGELWVINAGSRDTPNLMGRAIAPALRVEGVNRLDGMILTALNTVAAQHAGEIIDHFPPRVVLTSPVEWGHREWTLAGATVEAAMGRAHARQVGVTAGRVIRGGAESQLRVLWPGDEAGQGSVGILCESRGRRILLMDPGAGASLDLLQMNGGEVRADVVILLAPQKGKSDEAVRKILATTGAGTLIWCGRTAFAPVKEAAGELDTAHGAVRVTIDGGSGMVVGR